MYVLCCTEPALQLMLAWISLSGTDLCLQLVSEGSAPLVGVPAAAVDESGSGGPAGASDGRGQDDNDQDQPQHGFDQQVQCVSDTLGPLLEGLSPLQQGLIDEKLTQCCREHGGIAMATELAVSMVCARAAEAHGSLPLPYHLARVHVEEVGLLVCAYGLPRG